MKGLVAILLCSILAVTHSEGNYSSFILTSKYIEINLSRFLLGRALRESISRGYLFFFF